MGKKEIRQVIRRNRKALRNLHPMVMSNPLDVEVRLEAKKELRKGLLAMDKRHRYG